MIDPDALLAGFDFECRNFLGFRLGLPEREGFAGRPLRAENAGGLSCSRRTGRESFVLRPRRVKNTGALPRSGRAEQRGFTVGTRNADEARNAI